MTRINVGIHPSELDRDHLIAEHREMKRIPNMVASGRAVIKNIPNEFSLNSGHVKFFYTRLGYLHRRYKAVHAECIKRGYNVEDYSQSWESVPVSCLGDYTPKPRDREIIINRLIEKRSPSYKKLEFAINPSIKERI